MANLKVPNEGGSGGKRGHSNMEHWETTGEIKEASKSNRRRDEKREIRKELNDLSNRRKE